MDHDSDMGQHHDQVVVIRLDERRPAEARTAPAGGSDLDDWHACGAILCW